MDTFHIFRFFLLKDTPGIHYDIGVGTKPEHRRVIRLGRQKNYEKIYGKEEGVCTQKRKPEKGSEKL